MLKLRTVTGPHCKQPEGSTIEVGYVQCYAMNVSQVRKVLHATGSYGRLYRLRKVHNPYRSGYAWLRVWLCRLVYTQVCEHWLCASYARLHDPTPSSPMDDKVGYAWLCNERFAPSTFAGGYGRLQRLREVHNPYMSGYGWLHAWLCRMVYTQVCVYGL